jgi:hypothetical protein
MMGSETVAPAPDLKPAAIDPDHRQRRSRFHARLEFAGLKLLNLPIALGLQLLTNVMGDATGVPTTDGQFGEILQGFGCPSKEDSRLQERTILPRTEGL